jgi:hypothetical protein
MGFTEQDFSHHNQEEVKQDLNHLVNREVAERKTDLRNFRKEIIQQFDTSRLSKAINTLFKPNGKRNEMLMNETMTPSYDLVVQMCLIACGIETTKIDSDPQWATKLGIQQLKATYNQYYVPTPQIPLAINTNADSDFFKAVLTILSNPPQKKLGSVSEKKVEQIQSRDFILWHSFVNGYPGNTTNKEWDSWANIKDILSTIAQPWFKEKIKNTSHLIIDLGINDWWNDIATFQRDYYNLLSYITWWGNDKSKWLNYKGKIHIIGISQVYKDFVSKWKVIKTKDQVNARVVRANQATQQCCRSFSNITFHHRDIPRDNIAADGLHPKNYSLALAQVNSLIHWWDNPRTPSVPFLPSYVPYADHPLADQLYGTKGFIPPEWSEKSLSSPMIDGNKLDTYERLVVNNPLANKGTIEQFIPKKDYPILLNYEKTTTSYKKYTQVIAQRDEKQETYIIISWMPSRQWKRALIYPGVQVARIREKVKVDTIPTTTSSEIVYQRQKIEIHSQSISQKWYEQLSNEWRWMVCYQELQKLWFTPAIAAWIVGNLWVESHYYKKWIRFHTGARGDWGKSFGLCQRNNFWWTKSNGRLARLKKFAIDQGWDPKEYRIQLAFIKHEFETTEQAAWQKIQNATTAQDVAYRFMKYYERPRNHSTLKERQQYAQNIFNNQHSDLA